VRGDIVTDLATAAALIPAELPLVVFGSHVLPYLPPERRADFVAALAELSRDRPLWWISQEGRGVVPELVPPADKAGTPSGVLGAFRWVDGRPDAVVLARTADHGERIVWLAT
jgi:hypothetical protein